MTAIALNALFCLAAVIAIAVTWQTLARYRTAIRELFDEAGGLPQVQEVRFKLIELKVTADQNVVRPDFTRSQNPESLPAVRLSTPRAVAA